jgi:phosphoglycolate phosphatase-like HAD superfamily hydrolase
LNLHEYKTWIFDCDGVLLDSNSIKTQAFYEIVLPMGKKIADQFITFHKENAGHSRLEKFNHLFKTILQRSDYNRDLHIALKEFGEKIRQKLIECPETEGLRQFLNKICEFGNSFIVSGGMQSEVKDIISQKGLAKFFADIYGSPDTKEEIVEKMISTGRLKYPAIYFGDSRYDYETAVKYQIDFVFMTKYTEFKDWRAFFLKREKVVLMETFESWVGNNKKLKSPETM